MKTNFVKTILLVLVAVFCVGSVVQAKDKKKKKEKKEFVWKMPEKMTGIKDFDEYLFKIVFITIEQPKLIRNIRV